jgi:hypothetical protein
MKEHDRYRHGQLLKKHERLKESLRRVLVLHEEPWHGPNNYCECDVCEAARAALKDEAP